MLYGMGIKSHKDRKMSREAYTRWHDMMKRCYGKEYRKTYEGITVCKEWLTMSNFFDWYLEQGVVTNLEIDKDIINPDAKEYSPENCCFVPKELNILFRTMPNKRALPMGVSHNGKNTFKVTFRGKHISNHNTIDEAESAYINAKITELGMWTFNIDDERIVEGLERHIILLKKKRKIENPIVRPKVKPLPDEINGFKVLKDLGSQYPTEKSKSKARFAEFECKYCLKPFTCIANSITKDRLCRCK